MKHLLIPSTAALMLACQMLAAQTVEQSIADQLSAQGYQNISVTRTWLGRVRIEASADGVQREIVVNPRTGEILRDISLSENGRPTTPRILGAGATPDRSDGARSSGPAPGQPPSRSGPSEGARGPGGPEGAGSRGAGNGPGGPGGPGGGAGAPSGQGGPSR